MGPIALIRRFGMRPNSRSHATVAQEGTHFCAVQTRLSILSLGPASLLVGRLVSLGLVAGQSDKASPSV